MKSIKMAKESMFPIFSAEKLEDGQTRYSVIGTGYFVNADGYFVTASHIFDNASPKTEFLYAGKLPDNLQNPRLKIEEVGRDDGSDIFIGRVKDFSGTKYFHISGETAEEGKSVCISGYPLAKLLPNGMGGLEVSGVRRYFQPSFVLDHITMPVDNGKGKIRRHEGFLVRDAGLFGMSGGPVFDTEGVLVGMQASVATRVSESGTGHSISVDNACVIGSQHIIELLTKNKIKIS